MNAPALRVDEVGRRRCGSLAVTPSRQGVARRRRRRPGTIRRRPPWSSRQLEDLAGDQHGARQPVQLLDLGRRPSRTSSSPATVAGDRPQRVTRLDDDALHAGQPQVAVRRRPERPEPRADRHTRPPAPGRRRAGGPGGSAGAARGRDGRRGRADHRRTPGAGRRRRRAAGGAAAAPAGARRRSAPRSGSGGRQTPTRDELRRGRDAAPRADRRAVTAPPATATSRGRHGAWISSSNSSTACCTHPMTRPPVARSDPSSNACSIRTAVRCLPDTLRRKRQDTARFRTCV